MIAARPAIRRRASATSSGRWTKLSAIQSAPRSRPNCRSRRSLAVSGDSGRITFGHVDALAVGQRGRRSAPRSRMTSGPTSVDAEPDLAVVEQELGARRDRRERSRDGAGETRLLVARRRVEVEPERGRRAAARSGRSLKRGRPGASGPAGRPPPRSAAGSPPRPRAPLRSARRAGRGVPCEKLSRKASAPASNRPRICSCVELAGPSVARILVDRLRRMGCRSTVQAGSAARPLVDYLECID